MAITKREQQILDRADAGVPEPAIANELGLTECYVSQIVRAFRVDGSEMRRARLQMEVASRALLTAIQRERTA